MSIQTNYSNYFYIETATQLAAGMLGARLVQDFSWMGQGLTLGAMNHAALKGGCALLPPQANHWAKGMIKIGSLALTALLTLQCAPSLSSRLVQAVAALNLIVNLVFERFCQTTSATPPSSTEETLEPVVLKGTLTLPKPDLFHDQKTFIRGLLAFNLDNPEKTGVSKEMEDAFLLSHFPPTVLVKEDGTYLKTPEGPIQEQDLAITECVAYSTRENAMHQIEQTLSAYLRTHRTLPRKLIIPIGGCRHTSCLVIEPSKEDFTVTALDSIGYQSDFGYKEALQGARRVLQIAFPTRKVEIACNLFSQHNQMRCGFHTLKNIQQAAGYHGSIFDFIRQNNLQKTLQAPFSPRGLNTIRNVVKEIKKEVGLHFTEILRLNPGKIFVRTQGGGLKGFVLAQP